MQTRTEELEKVQAKLEIAVEALEMISGALDSWDYEQALHRVVDIAQNALIEME